ncbi:MAG: M48 family metallopeptidase [Syntrophobacteraceae bacterium]|nr:M48 family metallopeptidase [Syntrophobacteraceae bacterium]
MEETGCRFFEICGDPLDSLSYSVRVSRRASRVILRMIPGRGLEVVVPVGFNHRLIPEIIARKREWIVKAARRMGIWPGPARVPEILPKAVHLKALNRLLQVRYRNTGMKRVDDVRAGELHLGLDPDASDREVCRKVLLNWLKQQGKAELIPWLHRTSISTGLRFRKVQIRSQKSRWGSCSSRGTITLNCKLLFLPPELVRYIMIHELCHTVHMNHSREFWSLVGSLEPRFRLLDAEMSNAWRCLPAWAR